MYAHVISLLLKLPQILFKDQSVKPKIFVILTSNLCFLVWFLLSYRDNNSDHNIYVNHLILFWKLPIRTADCFDLGILSSAVIWLIPRHESLCPQEDFCMSSLFDARTYHEQQHFRQVGCTTSVPHAIVPAVNITGCVFFRFCSVLLNNTHDCNNLCKSWLWTYSQWEE